jgi:hypothetical protein
MGITVIKKDGGRENMFKNMYKLACHGGILTCDPKLYLA